MTILLILATALMLGALHAFDADHLAAVTSYIARKPSSRAALTFAVRWGAGHGATLLVVGVASTFFKLIVSPDFERAAELAVGAVLVGVGSWVLLGIARGRLVLAPHVHDGHAHTHLHRPDHSRGDTGAARHSIFWVGALHGLAGSAGLLVVIPVAMLGSTGSVIAYILSFSLGVTTAMALYAMAIGGLFGHTLSSSGARWYPWLAGATGASTFLLGILWLSSSLSGGA